VISSSRTFSYTLVTTLAVGLVGCHDSDDASPGDFVERSATHLPNNFPIKSTNGFAATFHTDGFVDLENEFLTPQGSNGRDCRHCHFPDDGWTLSSATAQRLFDETDGLHPLFNVMDADRGRDAQGNALDDVSTVEARRAAFSMMLKAKHRRQQTVPATAQFEVIGVDDPFGRGSATTFWFFRRSLPTANFGQISVQWDGVNTQATLQEGLARQVRGNITGAQQGTPPHDEDIVAEIVRFEMETFHAQLIVEGVGRLDDDGALGGPENRAAQPLVAGRFNLFDAWEDHENERKAQIFRGQELFNVAKPGRARCGGCHNAENDGQNVNGNFFDIGASRPEFAESDMAIYTLRNKETGEVKETTDGGRGWRTGRWADLDRFKAPSLRGLAARGEYLHNGIATSLMEVVLHYEAALNFEFTPEEREDLVAFMNAL
jgi:cytochrome c peroxidase